VENDERPALHSRPFMARQFFISFYTNERTSQCQKVSALNRTFTCSAVTAPDEQCYSRRLAYSETL